MFDHSRHLTEIQSRIILAIYRSASDYVNNNGILKGAGISRSTWAVEQNNLIYMGLLEKKFDRIISNRCVLRTASYKLSDEGKAVANNLLEISRIINSHIKLPGKIEEGFAIEDPEIFGPLRECIEVALEGYGVNFVHDVRAALESDYKIEWNRIPKRVDLLVNVLKDFFGVEGAATIEGMICKNICSRFSLPEKIDDLQTLVAEVIYGNAKPIRGTGKVAKSPRSSPPSGAGSIES